MNLRRPHGAPGLCAPLRCANGLPLRCGRHSSSDDPPGRARHSRNAPAKAVTLRAAHRPAKVSWPLLSLRGNSGEASRRPSGRCRLAGARPRSIGAEPGKGERKVFPCCSAHCAPVLRRGGWLAGFPAPFGHEQGKGFIGCILKRAIFQNGGVPLGIDPELDDDAASFALLCAQSGLTFPRLGRGIERGSFRTTGTAFLWRWS